MITTFIALPTRHFSTKRLQPFYSILKVRVSSTPEEIRNSYLKLIKIYHPDNLQTGDEKKFIQIKEAYDKIMSELPLENRNIKYKEDDNIEPDLTHKAYIDYIQHHNHKSILMASIPGGRSAGELYSKVKQKYSLMDKLARKFTT